MTLVQNQVQTTGTRSRSRVTRHNTAAFIFETRCVLSAPHQSSVKPSALAFRNEGSFLRSALRTPVATVRSDASSSTRFGCDTVQTHTRAFTEEAPLASPSGTPSDFASERSDFEEILLPVPPVWRGVADDPSLHNPLERQERLGTGWLGAVLEWEGVIVSEFASAHSEAWLQLAEEEGKAPPLAFLLKRAAGMKSEQVIQEVFCWSRSPMEVRRLAQRKLELFMEYARREVPEGAVAAAASRSNTVPYVVAPGVVAFLKNLRRHNVPCAVGCSASAALVEDSLQELNLAQYFTATVTADDVLRGCPDPEAYAYAAQAVGRVPARCVVIGHSNAAIEAAHDAGMKCIAVLSGSKPAYELSSADLVVRQLDELTLLNLKQLFSQEDMESPLNGGGWAQYEPEMELEEETESFRPVTDVADW